MAATCPTGSWAGWRPPGPTASRSSGRTADASWWRRRRTAGHRCRTACRSGRTPPSSEGLTLLETLSVEVAGERTQVDGGAHADLLLVNDDDLTFATVRPDPASLEILLSRGGELPSAVGRTLALTTAWGMLYDGELTAEQFIDCGVGVLTHETADSVIEPLLGRLVDAADHWAPAAAREQLQSRVSDLCISLADAPGRRLAALRGLAQSATTPAQLEFLATHATEPDLRWRRLIRLAELDQLDESDVESLLAEDPDPDAWVNALRARTARPTAEAKESAWQAVMIDRKVPQDVLVPGRPVLLATRPGRPGDAVRREVPAVPARARQRGDAVGPVPCPVASTPPSGARTTSSIGSAPLPVTTA